MRSKRRTFEPAFKREAVELSCSSDMTQKRVAEELGISPNLLSKWRRELLDDASQPTSAGVARGREVERLQAELAEKNAEIEFLKKATAYFVRHSRFGTR